MHAYSFCTESIYFWLDCNEYKDIPHRSYLKLRAQKIFRKYIAGNAKLQVNLESALIRDIREHIDDPSRTLFLAAQRSITKMLERDTLPKFRRSKHVRGVSFSEHGYMATCSHVHILPPPTDLIPLDQCTQFQPCLQVLRKAAVDP